MIAECHPERKHCANGLCKSCYYRARYKDLGDVSKSESREKSRRFRAKNPDYLRIWYRENADRRRDAVNSSARSYYKRKGAKRRRERMFDPVVRAAVLAKDRAWHKANPEKSAALAKAKKAKRRAAGTISAADIRRIADKQGGRCYWCGVLFGLKYHADHYIPVARGGTSDPENMVASCPPCNLSRRDKMPGEWSPRSNPRGNREQGEKDESAIA
jgi:5-methylcytosine-specific restriction endonuclease McrA